MSSNEEKAERLLSMVYVPLMAGIVLPIVILLFHYVTLLVTFIEMKTSLSHTGELWSFVGVVLGLLKVAVSLMALVVSGVRIFPVVLMYYGIGIFVFYLYKFSRKTFFKNNNDSYRSIFFGIIAGIITAVGASISGGFLKVYF
ncbi:MAG: hypothetical protein JW863_14765 [Chitinispirillaceae bacterium]|nr:hypothetical protein [Chitinispirillaceae bacterium]